MQSMEIKAVAKHEVLNSKKVEPERKERDDASTRAETETAWPGWVAAVHRRRAGADATHQEHLAVQPQAAARAGAVRVTPSRDTGILQPRWRGRGSRRQQWPRRKITAANGHFPCRALAAAAGAD